MKGNGDSPEPEDSDKETPKKRPATKTAPGGCDTFCGESPNDTVTDFVFRDVLLARLRVVNSSLCFYVSEFFLLLPGNKPKKTAAATKSKSKKKAPCLPFCTSFHFIAGLQLIISCPLKCVCRRRRNPRGVNKTLSRNRKVKRTMR